MNIADPHRGRKYQFDELEGTLWMDNVDCELNATLLHHLESIGWKLDTATFSNSFDSK
jgi:hypothetical protein